MRAKGGADGHDVGGGAGWRGEAGRPADLPTTVRGASRGVECPVQPVDGPSYGGWMRPADYPWSVPPVTGVVRPDGVEAGDLPSPEVLAERTPVVAVGSNASPDVLVRKLGDLLETGLPVAPAVVEDITVGHFAQVAARGFVAAAPALSPGARSELSVGWFDGAQLARLDETEPNYRRELLTSSCTWAGGEVVGGQIYVSDHGLLADEGEVLPLRPQAEVLLWLAERLPHLADDLTHDRLTDHDLRERVRLALIERRLVADPWAASAG